LEDVKVNLNPRDKVEILRKFYEFNLRQNALPLIGLPNRKENIFRQNFYIFIHQKQTKGTLNLSKNVIQNVKNLNFQSF